MPTLNPSAASPLLLLMGVVASVAVHQLFLWFGRWRETLHPKVRNDGNYWEQIESYISQHSDAQFGRDGVVKDQLDSWRGRL